MRFNAAALAAALAVSAAALLSATAAPAQTTSPAPEGTTAQQGAPGASQSPLMTAPRPDDKPTTDPTASQSGVSGSAPSDEMKRMEAPAGSAAGTTPGTSPSVAAIPGPIDPEHARALIGQELRSRDGQVAGTIKDFALDDAGDAITRIVLTPDDDVGTPKKMVSVPISMLQMEVPGPAAPGVELSRPPLLNLPAKELANAPEFTYSADVKTVGGKP
ncbi:PRC-barrel domain-containing protein [Azospirillum rugosum]|uniref:PRC-barrel domain-containing protein n=1 Tax=Azospirillum rugosum TaxID=416170 RepID=A0ABS4SGL4_9PROT|nr:PRC-barrel domain-containing protein [Azospirillum rugosum]MBP2291705.1 hypothetical protein [Azospirillum rugosum]MDQ0524483.1 hypothetical protein [Azospirillum rugosum]